MNLAGGHSFCALGTHHWHPVGSGTHSDAKRVKVIALNRSFVGAIFDEPTLTVC